MNDIYQWDTLQILRVERFEYGIDFDIEGFLRRSEQREEQRLKRQVEEIDRELEKRDSLSEQRLKDLRGKIEHYQSELMKEKRKPFGASTDKIDQLEDRIDELYKQKHSCKRRSWRDKQELLEERRRKMRKLQELNSKSIEDILDLL